MAMVCPVCKNTFEQRLDCPRCAVRLQFRLSRPRAESSLPGSAWQQTPGGRLLIGLLVAQGLYYGLHHLCLAGLLFLSNANQDSGAWNNTVLNLTLQAVGVLSAGVLTGAAQRRGIVFGAVVGVWNSILYLLAEQIRGGVLDAISVFGEPLMLAVFGAIGGLAGSLIWKPMPVIELPMPQVQAAPVPVVKRWRGFVGPVRWFRVVAGVSLAVGGVVSADVIREYIVEASEGRLRITNSLQADLMNWEISALAVLAGATMAGSSTFNGLKQGLFVGIGSAVVLGCVRVINGSVLPSQLPIELAGIVGLGLVGGWFGGQLLPPVFPRERARRRTHEPD
jgi:hypothetical protein